MGTEQLVFDNDPQNLDVWVNDTEHTFKLRFHMKHGEGPEGMRSKPTVASFTVAPHSEIVIPKMFRHAIHQYRCTDDRCKEKPGNKHCTDDHENLVIVGGQCPLLKRKSRPNIKLDRALDPQYTEHHYRDRAGNPRYALLHADNVDNEIAAIDARHAANVPLARPMVQQKPAQQRTKE